MWYEYQANVVAVHDGDTVTLDVDLGFGIWDKNQKFRLYGPDPNGPEGQNSPELNTPAGKAARDYLSALLNTIGNKVAIRTVKDKKEKFGRYLVVLFDPGTGENLNQKMIDAGHATLKMYSEMRP